MSGVFVRFFNIPIEVALFLANFAGTVVAGSLPGVARSQDINGREGDCHQSENTSISPRELSDRYSLCLPSAHATATPSKVRPPGVRNSTIRRNPAHSTVRPFLPLTRQSSRGYVRFT